MSTYGDNFEADMPPYLVQAYTIIMITKFSGLKKSELKNKPTSGRPLLIFNYDHRDVARRFLSYKDFNIPVKKELDEDHNVISISCRKVEVDDGGEERFSGTILWLCPSVPGSRHEDHTNLSSFQGPVKRLIDRTFRESVDELGITSENAIRG
jgi:hypothetical protein